MPLWKKSASDSAEQEAGAVLSDGGASARPAQGPSPPQRGHSKDPRKCKSDGGAMKHSSKNSSKHSSKNSSKHSSKAGSPAGAENATHLVVLVYGVGGSPDNWSYFKKQLEHRFGPQILVFCSNAVENAKLGIDILGSKLALEIHEVVSSHPALKRISIVGHSLGGVVSRFGVGKLLDPKPYGALPALHGLLSPKSVQISSAGAGSSSAQGSQGSTVTNSNEGSEGGKGGVGEGGNVVGGAGGVKAEEGAQAPGQDAPLHAEQEDPGRPGGTSSEPVPVPPAASATSPDAPPPLPSAGACVISAPAQGHGGTIAGLEPVNFVTLASPHLGSRGKDSLPFLSRAGFLEKHQPSLGPLILGETARHLFLSDGPPPLLLRMTMDGEDGMFISALAAFKNRTVYANVGGDQMVGWQTSSIRQLRDMPKPSELKAVPNFKFIKQSVELAQVGSEGSTEEGEGEGIMEEGEESSEGGESDVVVASIAHVESDPVMGSSRTLTRSLSDEMKKLNPSSSESSSDSKLEDVMAQNLCSVPWTRVDVSFDASKVSFTAHNLIQVKD